MLGAFSYLGTSEMAKGFTESIVLVVGFICMPLIMLIANKYKLSWLKEWSLGIVIIFGLAVGYIIS
jgi:hypothetical protein